MSPVSPWSAWGLVMTSCDTSDPVMTDHSSGNEGKTKILNISLPMFLSKHILTRHLISAVDSLHVIFTYTTITGRDTYQRVMKGDGMDVEARRSKYLFSQNNSLILFINSISTNDLQLSKNEAWVVVSTVCKDQLPWKLLVNEKTPAVVRMIPSERMTQVKMIPTTIESTGEPKAGGRSRFPRFQTPYCVYTTNPLKSNLLQSFAFPHHRSNYRPNESER